MTKSKKSDILTNVTPLRYANQAPSLLLLRARLASLRNRYRGVVGCPGQAISRVREAHTVHPASTSCSS